MPRIIIRVIRTSGFVTSAICWWTEGLPDHAEFGIEADGKIVGWAGAHSDGGFQIRRADYCVPQWERRYAIPVTQDEYCTWYSWIHSKLGTPYNFKGIAGLLFRARSLHSPKANFCSEIVNEGCEVAGIHLFNLQPDLSFLVTPRDIHMSKELRGRLIPND